MYDAAKAAANEAGDSDFAQRFGEACGALVLHLRSLGQWSGVRHPVKRPSPDSFFRKRMQMAGCRCGYGGPKGGIGKVSMRRVLGRLQIGAAPRRLRSARSTIFCEKEKIRAQAAMALGHCAGINGGAVIIHKYFFFRNLRSNAACEGREAVPI